MQLFLQTDFSTFSIGTQGNWVKNLLPTWGKFQAEELTLRSLPGLPVGYRPLGAMENGLVLTLPEGDLLHDWHPSIATAFYHFAKTLTTEVKAFHQSSLAIYALHPQNMVYDAEKEHLFILDLLTARSTTAAISASHRPLIAPSGLAYIAPEQTGRTQHRPSERSDFFSIGVVLLELLTGNNPFAGTDSLNTTYRLLTFSHRPVAHVVDGVHIGIWKILDRLLQKDPKRRYASAESLLVDLSRLATLAPDAPFEIADDDSDKFIWREGQFLEYELETALAFFQNLDASKVHGLLLIEGIEGTGKNVLVKALIGILPVHVFTARVDFGEASVTPYAPFSQLLNALTEYAFALPAKTLQKLKQELSIALHNNAILLTNLCPALLKLVPADHEVPELPPLETQNRLAFALSSYFQAFHRCGIALAASFDNCQLASSLNLQIINKVLYEMPSGTLMFVLNNNQEEVQDTPIKKLKNSWFSTPANIPAAQIQLKAWDEPMLQKVLTQQRIASNVITPTAKLILAKTGGNPALVVQLLHRAAKEQHLPIDAASRQFVPQLSAIEHYESTESVAQFQIKLAEKLSIEQRKFIEIGALLGRKFRFADVYIVLEEKLDDQKEAIAELLTSGLIRLSGEEDQAAYFTTKGFQKALLQQIPAAEKQRLLQAIVKLSIGSGNSFEALQYVLLLPPPQTTAYADLLVKGINEATQRGAFDQAYQYAAYRFEQFTPESWVLHQKSNFQICLECLRFTMFSDNLQANEIWIETVKKHAVDKYQLAHWAIFAVELYTMQARYQKAFEVMLPVLERFGVRLSTQPNLFTTIKAIVLLDRAMKGKSVEYVNQLPNNHDQDAYWKARMLQMISTAVFLTAPKMTLLLMSLQIRIGLRHGLSEATSVSFASYAFKLAAFDFKYDRANEMIALAHQLNQRYPNPLAQSPINFLAGAFVHHNTQPIRQVVKSLLENYRYSKENGVLGMAFYSGGMGMFYDFFAGTPLSELLLQYPPLLRQAEVNGITTSANLFRILLQAAESFSSATWSDQPISGTWYQLSNDLNDVDKSENASNAFLIRQLNFLYNALRNKPDDSIDFLNKYLENWRDFSPGTVGYAFFRLLMVIQCTKSPERINRSLKRSLAGFVNELQMMTKHNPANATSRYHLAAAVWANYEGRTAPALQHFEQAIEAAILNQNIIELLLSYEAKAQVLYALGLTLQGNNSIQLAWQTAANWGCWAQCNELKTRYPEVVFQPLSGNVIASNKENQGLDLLSFIRASTSINSEIKLEQLLEKLLPILSENAGSQRIALLLPQGKDWQIYAQQEVSKPVDLTRITAHQDILPEMMLQYAIQAQQPIALDNAQADRHYGQDIYLKKNRILSALCLPIVKNQQVKAIVYFENNSAPGAFNQQRLDILQLLSAQIAIALENALLYDDMETRVEQRTEELQEAMQQSEALLLNILPKNVAAELKENGYAAARLYPSASVMFTDFVNFTQVSENMRPEDLVSELDYCFRQFDAIIGRYAIEKIKTIGDAYLCAAGLPAPNPDHAFILVQAAIEIRQFIADYHQQRKAAGQPFFDIRIGIDSGPVVAGVVGSSKFAYDIWGNTVNTAARMEQNSHPGQINISGDTWSLVKDQFEFTYRGKIAAKNKGEVDMYFVG